MIRKQNFLRGGTALLLALLVSSFFGPLASAATDTNNPDGAFNVVVSPSSVGLTVKPGSTTSSDIKVQNHGLSTEHIKVTVLKFGAKGQDGTPQLEQIAPGDDFVNWIHFSSTTFDAEPNVWVTIHTTISPPPTAAFGYYYAVIFSRANATQTQAKQANLLGAVASLILLDVQSPGAVRQAKITQFSTPHKVQEFLPVSFTVQMHNTGNVHVASRGNIFISKGGKNLAILEVNLKKGYVLPNSYRKFTADWADGTPVYETKTNGTGQTLNWDNFTLGKVRYGKYSAKLVMVYNDGKTDLSTEAYLSFWVIPWRLIALVLTIPIVVVLAFWLGGKLQARKQQRKTAARAKAAK